MWRRFALTLCLLGAIAAPAFGQPAGASAEQKLRQEIEAVFTSWLEALNKGDGKAAAAFFVPAAPAINTAGVVQADAQDYANRIEEQHRENTTTTAMIERVQGIGSDAVYAIGSYTATFGLDNNRSQARGTWLQAFVRRGGTWKIAASSFTRVGPVNNVSKYRGLGANTGGLPCGREPGRECAAASQSVWLEVSVERTGSNLARRMWME